MNCLAASTGLEHVEFDIKGLGVQPEDDVYIASVAVMLWDIYRIMTCMNVDTKISLCHKPPGTGPYRSTCLFWSGSLVGITND